MNRVKKEALEPSERKAVRDYIRTRPEPSISRSVVDNIIRLAIASASRNERNISKTLKNVGEIPRSAACATPAFEHRLVSLFSE